MDYNREHIKSLVTNFMETNELQNFDEAFELFSTILFNDDDFETADLEEYYDDIVDGSGDKQIDSIHIDMSDDNILNIYQIKGTGGFSSNNVILIRNGIEWIFETDPDKIESLENNSFRNKIIEVQEALKMHNPSSFDVKVCYVTLGNVDDIGVNTEMTQEISKVYEVANRFGFKSFDFELIGCEEIYKEYMLSTSLNKKVDGELEIVVNPVGGNYIEKQIEDCKSLIITVKAKEIAKLVASDIKSVLFDGNVRKYLKKTSAVNKKIIESCAPDNAGQFWYLNNGITIICDKYDLIMFNPIKVKLENIQIVNGCQTSVSLFNAFGNGTLGDDAELLVRIHQTGDIGLNDKITIATNNQNPINQRDLFANDSIQLWFEEYYRAKYNLLFERKRNQYTEIDREKKKLIVKNQKLGQAFLAVAKANPAKSLGSMSKVFKEEYDTIFRKENIEKILLSYLIWQKCEEEKKNCDKWIEEIGRPEYLYDLIKKGAFHNAFILQKLVCNKDINRMSVAEINTMNNMLINGRETIDIKLLYRTMLNTFVEEFDKANLSGKSIFNFLKTSEANELCRSIDYELLLSSMA